MLPAIPTIIPMPFAQNGERRAIPETNTTPGSADASWATGFPAVTRINKQAGGKPPYGLDFQGLFHIICEHLFFSQSGNTMPWIGASDGQPGLNYLKGAIVQGSDGETYMALLPSGPDTPASAGAGMVGPVDPVGDESGHWINLKLLFAGSPNAEQMITASGTFTAPVTGWHEIHVWHGGEGGYWSTSTGNGHGGGGYAPLRYMVYFTAGETVAVSIGAGGLGQVGTNLSAGGGKTTFGDLPTVADAPKAYIPPNPYLKAGLTTSASTYLSGMGQGAGKYGSSPNAAVFYGAGGAVRGDTTAANCAAANGGQGAVLVRWYDPAKANGPEPAPALFAARRMARTAAEPAVVNLYDPETGQGSVWREEDGEAKLASGLITETAWLGILAARAAEERAAWQADPATEVERFELLRAARDARLAATDYLLAPDYPLSDDQRAAVTAYRQALRDLPAKEGAPWDGGGELTPWPAKPEFLQPQEG